MIEINERGLDTMEVEAEMMVMKIWKNFEREFLGSRADGQEEKRGPGGGGETPFTENADSNATRNTEG